MSMTEETKTKLESSTGDLSDVENGNCSSSGSGGDTKKTCADCGTSKTPLWRSGPAGPKSLCNACGIKSRKKRQAASGTKQDDTKIKSKTSNNNNDLVLDTTRNVKIVKPDSETVKIDKAEGWTVKNKIIRTDTENCNGNKKIKTDTEICSGNKRIKTDTEICNGNKKKDVESCNGNNKKNVKRANRFLDLGFKVPAMKRSSVEKKRLWRKLGEEEQAAVLLMTLSCG